MTRTHVPVLAGELIDLTGPSEGDRVVDCTFGAGGHARLMAERIGPSGTLVCVDRDPDARRALRRAGRRGALPHPLPADGLHRRAGAAGRRGLQRRPRVLRPRRLVHADRHPRARLLLLLRRAAGHAHGPGPGAGRARGGEHDGGAPAGQGAGHLRRGAQRPRDRARDRQAPPEGADRDHRPAGGRRRGRAARRRAPAIWGEFPCKARISSHPNRGQRRARGPGPGAAGGLVDPGRGRPPGRDLVPLARGPARQALPGRPRARLHLPARPARLPLRAHPRGRADHAPLGGGHARRGGRQPALGVRTAARGPPHRDREAG